MNQTTLIFPDSSSIVGFLIANSISNAEVKSSENKLTAMLSDDDVIKACEDYEAIKLERPRYNFNDESDS